MLVVALASLLFTSTLHADPPPAHDPRVVQVRKWVAQKLIVGEDEDGAIADVYVGRKFALLPLKMQTYIAEFVSKLAYDTGAEVDQTSIHYRSDTTTYDLGAVSFDDDGVPTATWEIWYRDTILQRDFARLK